MIHILDLNFLGNAQTIAAFLIVNGEDIALIETGPYSTYGNLRTEIERVGVKIEDIKHVFLSHIHFDHAGAAWAFAQKGAKIYVHPFGAKHLANPGKLYESARQIYREQMDILWGEMQDIPQEQIQEAMHEQVFAIGSLSLKAWHTPGHAVHHIAWQYGDSIFTGDVAGVHIGQGPVIAPLPPPDIDLEEWQKSINLLRQINPRRFYLTHFGEVSQITKHLEKLEYNIYSQANMIKDMWLAGKSIEEMIKPFEDFCIEELKKEGVMASDIAKYQGANPAFMSVAGLVRYWKKKLASNL
jgi:glyoxylase-like metal-dependent hydrolase (beta-lactamase superfamily II)